MLLQSILAARRKRRENTSDKAAAKSESRIYSGRFAKFFKFADGHGGLLLLICKVERFLGSAGLLGLSLYDLIIEGKNHGFVGDVLLESRNLPQLGLVATYVSFVAIDGLTLLIVYKCKWYTTILCALALIPNMWSQTFIRHTNFVLIAAFAMYIYRDVWPLATFTEQPLDAFGPLLYAKMSLLTLTAMLIPLFVPRRYIPVDPEVDDSKLLGDIY